MGLNKRLFTGEEAVSGFDLKFDPNRLYYYLPAGADVIEDNRLFRGNKSLITGQYEGECQTNFYFNSGDTGKHYMEMEMPSDDANGVHYLVFTDASAYTGAQSANSYFHRIGYFVGILYGTAYTVTYAFYRAGTGSDTDSRTFTRLQTAGQAIAIAVDASTRKVWMGKLETTGSVSWFGGGNPATNTTPTFTLPSGWGQYRLSAADGSYSGSSVRYARFRIRQTAEIQGGIPSGYSYMRGVYEV